MNRENYEANELEIHPLLAARHSTLAYLDKPVEPATLARLFEAARWAPSARNTQPWRFIYAIRGKDEAFERMVGVLTSTNAEWARYAPVLILAAGARYRGDPPTPNPFVAYDVSQAVAHLSFQASAEGLCMRQMGAFDHNAASAAFNIPAACVPIVIIAVGYEGSVDSLSPALRERAAAPRTRRPVGQSVGHSVWPAA